MATARLERLDGDNAARGRAVAAYRERIGAIEGVTATMAVSGEEEPAHHLFTVVLDDGVDRDGVRERLAEERIQTSLHYPPVHGFSIYDSSAELPLTEDYARRAITLPLFPGITEEQVGIVTDALAAAVSGS
jgi:dTDP-4-amino-4,6-dideoxygalactose transaminase